MTSEVSPLLAASIAENAAWCALVCRTHGIGTERAGAWTRTLRPAPAFHPDLITLDPTVTGQEVAQQLRDREACSVKDSFGSLDLESEGFTSLFEAEWMVVESDVEVGRPREGWSVVGDVDAFAAWLAGHPDDSPLRPSLLDDADTRFWLLSDGASSLAGFVAHRTGPVVAVSNAFSSVGDADLWPDLIALAGSDWGADADRLRVVTYERGEHIDIARAAGLVSLGPLTVWVRRSG